MNTRMSFRRLNRMWLDEQYALYVERREALPDDVRPRLLTTDEFADYAAEFRGLLSCPHSWPPLQCRFRLLRLLLVIG